MSRRAARKPQFAGTPSDEEMALAAIGFAEACRAVDELIASIKG